MVGPRQPVHSPRPGVDGTRWHAQCSERARSHSSEISPFREKQGGSPMMSSRRLPAIRMLAWATGATLGLCVPAVVMAQGSAPATAKATTATAKKHVNRGAAADQAEMNEHLAKMTERLKLSDDQVAKVREIMQSKMGEMKALRAKYKGQPS